MAVIKITKKNFEQEVMKSDKPVLIDFFADWCGPCRMVGPVVEELAGEVKTAKVCKVNVDEEGDLAQAFGVISIPTLVVVNGGKVAGKAVGVRTKADLKKMLGV